VEINGQRAAALRFADTRVQALMQALLLFVLLPHGFSNRDVREHLAPLLGCEPSQWRPGKMTYDLRRLRLHGLIERIPKTHRYRITEYGLRTAMFYSRVYNRILRPGLAMLSPAAIDCDSRMRRRFSAMNDTIYSWCDRAKLAA
jgi:predicted MarR family transcription regulator